MPIFHWVYCAMSHVWQYPINCLALLSFRIYICFNYRSNLALKPEWQAIKPTCALWTNSPEVSMALTLFKKTLKTWLFQLALRHDKLWSYLGVSILPFLSHSPLPLPPMWVIYIFLSDSYVYVCFKLFPVFVYHHILFQQLRQLINKQYTINNLFLFSW